MKLDLGCGHSPKAGHEGVDLFLPTADHRVNLYQFPWPWADSSVDGLYSSHFLEHIPMAYITPDGEINLTPHRPEDRDLLCRFMEEAHRILVPGGEFHIVVPSGRSNRAFQDPTHRRFFVAESFQYFNKTWRKRVGIDHYLCSCDFDFKVWPTIPDALLNEEASEQRRILNAEWNATLDWNVVLTAKK